MRARKLALRVAYVALLALLVGEIGARLATYEDPEAELAEFPELAERLERTRRVMRVMTVGTLLGPVERFPAPRFVRGERGLESRGWTTFGELEADAFVSPPASERAAPGVVRIAFFGGSTTFEGYPERVSELFAEAFGEGRVEVLNLGVPASHSGTTLLLMRRFVPRWRPHVVVVYHGFNDLVFYRSRARALAAIGQGDVDRDAPAPLPPRGSRGLYALTRELLFDDPLPASIEESIWLEPNSTYWEMDRMAWAHGHELLVSTFGTPYVAEPLDDRDRAYYAADLRHLWPMLDDAAQYREDLSRYNAELRVFAGRSGARLVDVEPALDGGRADFRDTCHRTEEGQARHARLVFDALRERVASLLAAGAPAPRPRPARGADDRLGPSAFDASADGTCRRGTCPEGACFVPAGTTRFGYGEAERARWLERFRAAMGFGTEVWAEDDGPEARVEVSAFCVDRTEASAASAARCVAAGACPDNGLNAAGHPDADHPDADTVPAVFPTAIDAEAYCGWRGGRLPTDAEWEAAARGMDGAIDWSGVVGNYCGRECAYGAADAIDDGHPEAAPIASFASTSPHGLVDTAGNLWEWVLDCFDNSIRARADGVRDPVATRDPVCRRFMRGGSYRSFPGMLERRVAHGSVDISVPTRGARCVYDFGTEHTAVSRAHRAGL